MARVGGDLVQLLKNTCIFSRNYLFKCRITALSILLYIALLPCWIDFTIYWNWSTCTFILGKFRSFQCWVVDELYTIHGSDAALGIGISVLILFYWQADYYQP